MHFRIIVLFVLTTPLSIFAQTTQPAVVEENGAMNIYTTHKGVRARALSITPEGSLIAGGVSTKDTPPTNVPPVMDPGKYDNDVGGERRNWIHDFYFGRYETPGEGQPRLHVRGLIMWGRGDSPDVQLGRTGPDNSPTAYGPPEDTEPGTNLGKVIFTAWGEGQFQGDIAGMYARNDAVPTSKKNPGSLHLGTAGESTNDNAWRDMIDRLVITSRGYVGIGDEFTQPAERLHVQGNVRVDGDITVKGTITASEAPRVHIEDPARSGDALTYASTVTPAATVSYRGEARLRRGRADVKMPEEFERITQSSGRTVIITNVDGFDRLAVKTQSGRQVKHGRLIVISDNSASEQAFTWQVTATLATSQNTNHAAAELSNDTNVESRQ